MFLQSSPVFKVPILQVPNDPLASLKKPSVRLNGRDYVCLSFSQYLHLTQI